MKSSVHDSSAFIANPLGKSGGAIYIHIPFCKQACHYCDFHFSTSLKKKDEMILALAKEMQLRKTEFESIAVETIYFGGGTPSILSVEDLKLLLDEVFKNFNVVQNPEITIEANPDDLFTNLSLHSNRFEELRELGVTRLSIGIQSFFEDDLKIMNRAHNAEEAKKCLEFATQYFDNISIDLIYGIPNMTNQKWLQNIQTALSYGVPHISSYALTVEPKTALKQLIKAGTIPEPKDEVAQEHFEILVKTLNQHGFIQYELSNFGKPNYFSKNNSGYWLGKKYLGIGPSAHSFDGIKRSWNIANNSLYIKGIKENKLPSESEILTKNDRYNEYIMTGLRTVWGVSLGRIENDFGTTYTDYLLQQAQKFLADDLLIIENAVLLTTAKGKFLSDGIASDLFIIND